MSNPADRGPWHLRPQLADDTHPIARLGLSDLQLMDDANHPWLILVPRVVGAVELIDLDEAQQAELTREIATVSRALQAAFAPYKLNIAMLGNIVSQLHVHVIARYEHDIAWPRPVWGTAAAQPYSPEALVQRIERLQSLLAQA